MELVVIGTSHVSMAGEYPPHPRLMRLREKEIKEADTRADGYPDDLVGRRTMGCDPRWRVLLAA